MFKHEKLLFHPVEIEKPNPQYAALLHEQLGGGNGELKAAMQYMSQSFRIRDAEIKDLFLDIAAEELSHMEMVAQTINLLNGHDVSAASVPAGEIQTHVQLGLNPGLINASVRRPAVQHRLRTASQGGLRIPLPPDCGQKSAGNHRFSSESGRGAQPDVP